VDTQTPSGEPAESQLCLLLAQPEKVNEMNVIVLKKIMASGCTPLIVTVNKPNKVLAKVYAKEGISPESYYVIDAVTQYSGGEPVPGPRVKYVNNPANLTDLGIAITEILKQMPAGKKCILFDSVSMLLIHIPSATASKFLHFVVNKLKLSDVSGIFLCVEKGLDPVILSQMSAFVDNILDYDKTASVQCLL
jgi:KaiC/GvpD/RAD55 family RecA-like ATPase